MNVLLPSVYLGNIQYYSLLKNSEKILIEAHEHYVKQTFRNRAVIYGANGPLDLIIPVVKGKSMRKNIRDTRINYSENWQKVHWRSIESAYRTSPYFEYYEHELIPFFGNKKEFLFDYNIELQEKLCSLLGIETNITFTASFEKEYNDVNDYRDNFDPKLQNDLQNFTHYTQVFENKHGFIPNLSIIDLLFACGPEANSYF